MSQTASNRQNTAQIRKLLSSAFSDEELRTFCFDNFPEVCQEFAAGMSFQAKVQLLLEYCERRMEFARLLALVKTHNPAQYARFGFDRETPFDQSVTSRPVTVSRKPGQKKMDRVITIVVAIVTVLGVAFTVYAYFYPAPPSPTTLPTFEFQVEVQAQDTKAFIVGAQARLQISGQAPLTTVTDSQGLARFKLDAKYKQQPARLIIDAPGYQSHRQEVTLPDDDLPLPVQLQAE